GRESSSSAFVASPPHPLRAAVSLSSSRTARIPQSHSNSAAAAALSSSIKIANPPPLQAKNRTDSRSQIPIP
uniref:Uncharacterized protein n=1 Tax=Oryza brachyantha TaxID=4533 RepID=J3L031_ORYBR